MRCVWIILASLSLSTIALAFKYFINAYSRVRLPRRACHAAYHVQRVSWIPCVLLSDRTSSFLREIASMKKSSENLTTSIRHTDTRRTYVSATAGERKEEEEEKKRRERERRLLPTIKAIYSRVKVSFVGIMVNHRSRPRDSPFLRLQLHLPSPPAPAVWYRGTG